ncbi:MAG: 3'-5' exonuclease domain-containing protein 2 [Bacteroidales bacterium]|nr:3'-5' exonuclease domain-containing protein 2 [Bacteroidales bacterium]
MRDDISNEEIEELPLKSFEGDIIVVETMEQCMSAEKEITNADILGFDTETKPAFKKGVTNGIALLQLATTDKAWLFRLNKTELPSYIEKVLSDPKVMKIGVAIRDDISKIRQVCNIEPKGFVELQSMAEDYNIKSKSLKKLAAIVLNIKVSKKQRLSNWESEELSEAQMRYAATDAWVPCEIYKQLICKN